MANEVTGDRPWLGEMYLVAVYSRALDLSQVAQNFSAGLPPYIPAIDGDIQGDACDNDAVVNDSDSAEFNNKICQDMGADMCDDCSIGVDGFDPLIDDDNDGKLDDDDNCPLQPNTLQEDSDKDGIGDAYDTDSNFCVAVTTSSNKVLTFCL